MARLRAPSALLAGGQQLAQHVGHRRRGLAGGASAAAAGDALDHHRQLRVAQVEGDAGEQMGGADGGEVDAQRADRHAGIGPVGDVHGEQFGVAGERLAAQRLAPGDVAAPGGAVDPAGAVTPCARGIDGGAVAERLQLGLVAGGAGHHEVA